MEIGERNSRDRLRRRRPALGEGQDMLRRASLPIAFYLLTSAATIVGAVLLPLSVYAQTVTTVTIHKGFLTGEQYLHLTEGDQYHLEALTRMYYAMGLIDGIILAPLLGGSERRTFNLGECLDGMTSTQVDAILSKYLNENPRRWHESAHTSMYAALVTACPGVAP